MHIWADKNIAIAASCFIYIEIVRFDTRMNVALILRGKWNVGTLKRFIEHIKYSSRKKKNIYNVHFAG